MRNEVSAALESVEEGAGPSRSFSRYRGLLCTEASTPLIAAEFDLYSWYTPSARPACRPFSLTVLEGSDIGLRTSAHRGGGGGARSFRHRSRDTDLRNSHRSWTAGVKRSNRDDIGFTSGRRGDYVAVRHLHYAVRRLTDRQHLRDGHNVVSISAVIDTAKCNHEDDVSVCKSCPSGHLKTTSTKLLINGEISACTRRSKTS